MHSTRITIVDIFARMKSSKWAANEKIKKYLCRRYCWTLLQGKDYKLYTYTYIYKHKRIYIHDIYIWHYIKKKKEKQLISLMGEVFESCGRRFDNDK